MPDFKRVLKAFCLIAVFSLVCISPASAYASLVTIDPQGGIVFNVLSVEDTIELEIPRRDYLEVKDIADETPDPNAKISLLKEDGKIKLQVSTESGDKSLDVTHYKDEVIEILERPESERLTIGVSDGKFIIEQRGVVAETEFAINIDPQTTGLTLETPSGLRFLSILPREATEAVLRSKFINRIGAEQRIYLEEEEGQDLAYLISGDKVINLFNIFEYSTPVKAKVSASTGEILSVEQPTWLKIIGFLFV